MKRKSLLMIKFALLRIVCIFCLVFVGLVSSFSSAYPNSSPNILLITADDMSWDSLGCTGNPLKEISPNLDLLAEEGILIDNCHVVSTICGPSRQALYTGQYPQRSGYMGHGVQPPRWWKASENGIAKKSIVSELRNNGYQTGVVGKHGSSWCSFSVTPFAKNAETGMGRNPQKFYGFAKSFFDRSKKDEKPFFLAANAHDPHRYWARHRDENKSWINAMMGSDSWKSFENGKPFPDPLTRFLPGNCPVPASYPNNDFARKELSKYYDSCSRMDQVVGELVRALKESGLSDKTVVFFLSDHGLAWDMSKWSLYPSGTKTPLIIRWPGKIMPGKRDEKSIVSAVDLAPTIAEICGLPKMQLVDGKSFLCLLEEKPTKWNRREAFSCFNYMNNHPDSDKQNEFFKDDLSRRVSDYRPSRALSSVQYTYVWNGWADGNLFLPRSMLGEYFNFLDAGDKQSSLGQRAKFIKFRVEEELYDVVSDPGCLKNLSTSSAHHATLKSFRLKMDKLLKKTGDHESKNYGSFLAQAQKFAK